MVWNMTVIFNNQTNLSIVCADRVVNTFASHDSLQLLQDLCKDKARRPGSLFAYGSLHAFMMSYNAWKANGMEDDASLKKGITCL